MPLPGNLDSIYRGEEEIRERSVREIEAREALNDHIQVVHLSLNLLYDYATLHPAKTDDERTVALLGIRLFNAALSILRLGLSGYYQTAFAVHRDLVETSFLLNFFELDRTRISKWKASTRRERLTIFSPRAVREELNRRDGVATSNRDSLYAALCEAGSHPTYAGNRIIAPNRFANVGPFFDSELLEVTVNELAKRLPHTVLLYVLFFDEVDPGLARARTNLLRHITGWAKKHLGVDLDLSGDPPAKP